MGALDRVKDRETELTRLASAHLGRRQLNDMIKYFQALLRLLDLN